MEKDVTLNGMRYIISEEESKIIVVIGLPASGKTTVAKKLHEQLPDYSFYSTDDYMEHGYEESLYKLMSDLEADQNPFKIIEGVQGYRLLRKGAQLGSFKADLIITTEASTDERAQRYKERGKELPHAMDKNLQKVWAEFLSMSDLAHGSITIKTGLPF